MYEADIHRQNPSCLLFLIDQSYSMSDPFGRQPSKRKADGVADSTNRTLKEVIIRSSKKQKCRDYFHVGIIGYGLSVAPALGGVHGGQELVPLSKLSDHPIDVREEDGKQIPIWVRPEANGKTPMVEALRVAHRIVSEFVAQHPTCFPPSVFNVTDGLVTDGDPREAAAAVRGVASDDGNTLLYNIHISDKSTDPIMFPKDNKSLVDDYARLLFEMSSTLPEFALKEARKMGFSAEAESRAFAFNADFEAVGRFFDLGTKIKDKMP